MSSKSVKAKYEDSLITTPLPIDSEVIDISDATWAGNIFQNQNDGPGGKSLMKKIESKKKLVTLSL